MRFRFARIEAISDPAGRLAGLPVAEYHNREIKKSVVGTGRAAKQQVAMMVRALLPGSRPDSEDAADALAVAICHAHHGDAARRRALMSVAEGAS